MNYRLNRSLPSFLWHQFGEFIFYYLGALICLYFTHNIQSFLPFMAKELADSTSQGMQEVETWKFFAMAVGIIVFRTASRLLFFYPARVMQKNIQVELLERLEGSSPWRYKHYPQGQVFQIVGNDIEQIRALVGFALLQVGNIIIALIVLVPKIVSFHAELIIALTPMLIALILFTIIVDRNRIYYKKTQDLQGEIQNFIMESYVGKKTIKNYQAEKSFIKLFKEHSFAELYNFYRAGLGISFSIPLIPLGVGFSLLWGAYVVKVENLGASSLILFSGFIFLFLEPLMFVSWIGVVISRSHAAWVRIKGLVSHLSQTSNYEKNLKLLNKHFELTQQERIPFVLEFWNREIKLDTSCGKWTVLIGKTGHGKSHLLQQMAEVLKDKGASLSYVAQTPYLYNDSVENNIFLGRERNDEDRERAYKLLKLFGLDYLESSAKRLLSMEVGEHGKHLSGGQAKRLGLVRSLMSDANYLIWDDPFSSVDVILERQIIDELKKSGILLGKTMILSSHRLSTVRCCDEVIFIDKTKGVVEKGEVSPLLSQQTQIYAYFQDQMV